MCTILYRQVSSATSLTGEYKANLLTVLWPRGRCRAWHLNSFSRYGTEGMDYESGKISIRVITSRETLTPPSRIRSGITPHSSLIAASRALNHSPSTSPSHQSVALSILTWVDRFQRPNHLMYVEIIPGFCLVTWAIRRSIEDVFAMNWWLSPGLDLGRYEGRLWPLPSREWQWDLL